MIVFTGVLLSACGSHRAVSDKHDYITTGCDTRPKKPDHHPGKSPAKGVLPMPKDSSHPVYVLLDEAAKWLGTRYEYGGHSRGGTDCSGMVMEVFKASVGILLPRNSREQMESCKGVERKQLEPGDLVFFANNLRTGHIGHVGLYVGDGKIIHATSSRGVIVSSLDEDYWRNHYAASGRMEAFEKKVRKHESSARNRKKDVLEKPASEGKPQKSKPMSVKSESIDEPVTAAQTATISEPGWFD